MGIGHGECRDDGMEAIKLTHTPGPWQFNQGTGEIIGVRDGCSMPIIATTSAWWPGREPGTHASQDVQWANARLIASAPEMFAALEALVNTIEDLDSSRMATADPYGTTYTASQASGLKAKAMLKARAAIAKAIGE